MYDVLNRQHERTEREGLGDREKQHHTSLIPIGFSAECAPHPDHPFWRHRPTCQHTSLHHGRETMCERYLMWRHWLTLGREVAPSLCEKTLKPLPANTKMN